MLEIRPANTLTVPSFASRTVNLDVDLGALAIRYVFSTTITDADPGDGKLRLSATQQDAALTIRADTLDVNGADVSGILDSFDDSTSAAKGSLRIYKVSDPTKWLVFNVSAVASPAGYRNITVSNIAASETSPFADGEIVLLSFTPTGEKGTSIPAPAPGNGGLALVVNDASNDYEVATPYKTRIAANVRGRVNFFDFLQITRTSAVREAIMNGTSTDDLAVELQQFRDALADIRTAGGRPYGLIPESKIYTSVAVNLAMDYLDLETQGVVRIRNTSSGAAGRAIVFDGTGLGNGGFGPRYMNVGPMIGETEFGDRGISIINCQQSEFNGLLCLGAVTTGYYVSGCVSTVFRKPSCAPQVEAFLATPAVGLRVTGGPGTQTSWCSFEMPIFEYTPIGIQLEYSLGNSFLSGVAEGCTNFGLVMTADALRNKFFGFDMEANTNGDLYCEGAENAFFSCDAGTGSVQITAATGRANRLIGGSYKSILLNGGANSNLIAGVSYNTDGTGALTDIGVNILENNYNLSTGKVHSGYTSGWVAIDITSQPVEDTFRTWRNPYGNRVQVLLEATATDVWYKNNDANRYDLGAGGQAVEVGPGDAIQVGYVSAPDVRFRFI